MKIVLVDCFGILGDIITNALRGSDLEVIAQVRSADLMSQPPQAWGADTVLWNGASADVVAPWLERAPSPRVLTTTGDGRQTTLWRLAACADDFGALSPTDLVDTLRSGDRTHPRQES